MRSSRKALLVSVGAAIVAAAVPASSLAASGPVIEGGSLASSVSPHDAILQARINPEGVSLRGAVYQFQVVSNPSEFQPEIACPERQHTAIGGGGCTAAPVHGALPIEFAPPGMQAKQAQISLLGAGVTLTPGSTYHFRVLAATMKESEDQLEWDAPPVVSEEGTFTMPPASAPVIESLSVSHVTSTDATLEAQVDTEGLSTSFEFQLLDFVCGKRSACMVISPIPLPKGQLLGSFLPQRVSLDLNSAGVVLHGGGEYGVSVKLINTAGTAERGGLLLEPPEAITIPPGPPSGGTPPPGQSSPPSPAGPSGPRGAQPIGTRPPYWHSEPPRPRRHSHRKHRSHRSHSSSKRHHARRHGHEAKGQRHRR
ncbi:MAG: hypothetical protein FWD42_04980 [Solirubrobacterales bacterium]|nr:hypothetical protein [Solirubrobacterales bacterium]